MRNLKQNTTKKTFSRHFHTMYSCKLVLFKFTFICFQLKNTFKAKIYQKVAPASSHKVSCVSSSGRSNQLQIAQMISLRSW